MEHGVENIKKNRIPVLKTDDSHVKQTERAINVCDKRYWVSRSGFWGKIRKDSDPFKVFLFKHWILNIAYRYLIPLLEILKKILSERLRFGARLKPPHSLLSPHYSQYWFPIIHSTGGELPWKISHSQTSNVFLHKMDNSQTSSSWKSDYAR